MNLSDFPVLPVTTQAIGGDEAVLVTGACFGLATLRLEFAAGSVGEATSGTSHLALEMLERGTRTLDREDVRRRLDVLGARFGAWAGRTSCGIQVRALEEVWPETLALVEELLCQPADDEEELEDVVAELDESFEAMRVEPGAVAGRLLAPALWADSPWGKAPEGTRASRALVSGAAVTARRKALFRAPLRVGVAADEPARLLDGIRGLVERIRGVYGPCSGDPLHAARPEGLWGRTLATRVPETPQGAVLVAAPVPGIEHGGTGEPALHDAIELHNACFGGGFSAPLVKRIRGQEGLSYGVGTSIVSDRANGLVVFSAQPEGQELARTVGILSECWDTFTRTPVDETLLELSRRMLLGQHRVRLETARARLSAAMHVRGLGLPVSDLWESPSRIAALPASAVNAVNAAYGFGRGMTIVAALPEGASDPGWASLGLAEAPLEVSRRRLFDGPPPAHAAGAEEEDGE